MQDAVLYHCRVGNLVFRLWHTDCSVSQGRDATSTGNGASTEYLDDILIIRSWSDTIGMQLGLSRSELPAIVEVWPQQDTTSEIPCNECI